MSLLGFDYVIVGVGENYKTALENAERRLPAPLRDTAIYAKVQVGKELKCADGLSKVEIKYNLKAKDKPLERIVQKKPASAGTKNPLEMLNE